MRTGHGKKLTVSCLMLIMLFGIGIASAQNPVAKAAPEPTFFSEDADPNPFWDSDTLPANVLDMLKTSKPAEWAADRLKGLDQAGFAALFDCGTSPVGQFQRIGLCCCRQVSNERS